MGADGIRSKIRELKFGAAEPIYSGFAAWRYVIPRPEDVTDLNWFWGVNATIGIVPLSPSAMYIAGTSFEPEKPKFPTKDLARLFREKFSQFEADVPTYLKQVVDPEKVVYTPLEEVRIRGPWYDGRIVVVGDAAHAATPFWALGVALAIEDVALLARFIAKNLDPAELLPKWFDRRYPRCVFVQDGSVETGKQMHSHTGDGPRLFPPRAREGIRRGMEARALTLAEPY
ncbi:MAG: FAD-dependent monooxygenase [Pseudomonadota bacterium]|nr:FAD-dependent monooxygenase [Pseudomonadota bacterium]